MAMNRNLAIFSATAVLLGLVACGGGGGGNSCTSNSFIGLIYKDSRVGDATSLSSSNLYFASFEKVTFNPVLPETCGAAMSFSASLPAGLVLDPTTGVISGIPTTFGIKSALARVRIAGYSGEATHRLEFTVDDFSFGYSTAISPLTVISGSSVSLAPTLNDGMSINPGFGPVKVNGQSNATRGSVIPAGATMLYSLVLGVLPPGITLDPSSGLIGGTPTTAGIYDFKVGLAVTFQGATIQAPIGTTAQSLRIIVI